MIKYILAAAAIVAASSFAQAERNYDLRDSDTYVGKYSQSLPMAATATEVQPLAAEGDAWLTGLYGLSKDPMEIRRWDEKNN
jgi:hypothetical protein